MFGKFFRCLFQKEAPLQIELNKERQINARLANNGKQMANEYQSMKGKNSALNQKYQRLQDENIRRYKEHETTRIELSEVKAKGVKDYNYMVELENEILLTNKPELLNDISRKNLRLDKIKSFICRGKGNRNH